MFIKFTWARSSFGTLRSKGLREAKKSAALAYAKSILKGRGVGFEYGLHTYEPVGKSRRVHFEEMDPSEISKISTGSIFISVKKK